MVRTWRKYGVVVLACLMVITLVLAGCGQTQPTAGSTAASSGGAAGGTSGGSTGSAKAEPDYAFYNGKTVTFVVATSAGGGYDSYGRLIAPYLQKYLPGSTVIVKNVPGAGHIIGANEIYNAKPDGLTLGTFNKGLIMSQIAGMEGIKFDMSKFTWIGNASSDSRVLIINSSLPYKTMDDIVKSGKELKLASAGVGSASSNDGLMVSKIFGFKVKLIAGYSGQQADLGMMKREIDGQVGAYDSMKSLIDQGQARAIVIIGTNKVADLPNVPMLSDIAPASSKAIVDLMDSQASLARPIGATPGIPEGRVLALREALQKALSDPELLAKAKQAQLPINYLNGDDMAKTVSNALNQPPDVVSIIKEAVNSPSKEK